MFGMSITRPQRFAGLCIPNLNRTNPCVSQNIGIYTHYNKTQITSSKRIMAHASASSDLGIESVGGIRPEVEEAIQAALVNCLTETDLGIGKKYRVREKENIPLKTYSSYTILIFNHKCPAPMLTSSSLSPNN